MPSAPASLLAERVVIILVGPQHPGNVGAAARAMKNMGLRRLVIASPPPSFDPERARWMAPGAADILASARIVPDLDAALEGVHRAVATTARHRGDGQPVHEPATLAAQVFDADDDHVTAVLFGREDTGLTREEVQRCESLLRIPTDHHASLNLGQAVLLVAHHFFEAARAEGLRAEGRLVGGRKQARTTRTLQRTGADARIADVSELEPAVVESVALLNRVGYTKSTSPERVAVTVREALQRASIRRKQLRAFRGMLARIDFALDHPEINWRASKRQQALKDAVPPLDDDPSP